jgi:hypothetical protein
MQPNYLGKINILNSRSSYYEKILNSIEEDEYKNEFIKIINNYFSNNNFDNCKCLEELQKWIDIISIDKKIFIEKKKFIISKLLKSGVINILEYCNNYSILNFIFQNLIFNFNKLPKKKYTINYYLHNYFDTDNFDNNFFNINIFNYNNNLIKSNNNQSNITLNIYFIKNDEKIINPSKIKQLNIDLIILNNPQNYINSLLLKYCNINNILLHIINLNYFEYEIKPFDDTDKKIFKKYFNNNLNKNQNKHLEKKLGDLEFEFKSSNNILDLEKIQKMK